MKPLQVGRPHREPPDVASSADAYARRFDGAVGELLLSRQTEAVLELLAPWPGSRVLDVGGGHAQLAGPLARAGYRVTVLASRPGLHARVRRLREGNVDCLVGPLEALPCGDGSFDVVTCFRVLAHAPDWQRLVTELARAARHGVVVDFPPLASINALAPWLFWLKRGIEGDTRPFRVLRHREVAQTLREHGFGRVETRRELLLPMALHRLLSAAAFSRWAEGAARHAGLTQRLGSPAILRATRDGERAALA